MNVSSPVNQREMIIYNQANTLSQLHDSFFPFGNAFLRVCTDGKSFAQEMCAELLLINVVLTVSSELPAVGWDG